ncbi:MAG: phage holin family protein [Paludibacterium sp.]|uniref:putative holin n=1 Tax=Paludibacterium sp. TaxID=1917523 RepID=UPI0025E00966|nr:putative holin [Paludibacterium sp.]MBV8046294.1 phage holin family protein [Paludibacterium sp.]MBV8647707.1 phage holin family protein [Paludibacterium sp.]
MAEPASTAAVMTAGAASMSILTLFPGLDATTVLGAFAGASVFVLSSNDLGPIKKLVFLILAFVAGLIAAPLSSALLTAFLPAHVQVSESVGALLASALVIKVLTRLIARADNPAELLPGPKGDQK